MFSVPIKGRSRCYGSKYGHMRTWNIHNAIKTLYIGIEVELLLQFENKQQIMQNNVETQHNRMYSLYIGSLCTIAFLMARFTCIVTSQVFVEIWMRWSIVLSSAFYTGRIHLWIVFSFNMPTYFETIKSPRKQSIKKNSILIFGQKTTSYVSHFHSNTNR